jgi:hypothetical protein
MPENNLILLNCNREKGQKGFIPAGKEKGVKNE